MEVNTVLPRPSEILSAELVGLQYGLASAKDIVSTDEFEIRLHIGWSDPLVDS